MPVDAILVSRTVPVQVRLPEDLDVAVEELLLEMRRRTHARISKTELIGALLHDATSAERADDFDRLAAVVQGWRAVR